MQIYFLRHDFLLSEENDSHVLIDCIAVLLSKAENMCQAKSFPLLNAGNCQQKSLLQTDLEISRFALWFLIDMGCIVV
jgi:hypothetical protein